MKSFSKAVLGVVLGVVGSLPAQSVNPVTFDTFGDAWNTGVGVIAPGPNPALVEPSLNGIWRKVVWGRGQYWPLVDYLAENVTTAGPSRLILSVTPPAGPGLPAGGAEILTDWGRRVYGFGSYRIKAKVSPATAPGVGVCNAFYFINDLCEIDLEFLSDQQGKIPGMGQIDIVVHDYTYLVNHRITVHRPHPLPFDPTAGFHVYGFDWHPGRIDFYADDVLITSVRTGDPGLINIGGNAVVRPLRLPDETNVQPSAMRLSNWTDLPGWCGVAPSVQTDFEVDWVSYAPFYFTTDTTRLSIQAGGTASLSLGAGSARAGKLGLILGSLRAVDRGFQIPFPPGFHMPFEFDLTVTPVLLGAAGSATLPGFLSMFDAQGAATAGFRLLPGQLDASAVGLGFCFAYVAIDPLSGLFEGCSSGLTVRLAP